MEATLLIVEDNRALSLAMSALAERCGFAVTAVPTLARAGEAMEKTSFEVILLDIGLPDGNGLALLKRPSFRKVPVIAVVSAHGEIENAIAARKLGVVEFFDKPIDFEALEKFLREQCQSTGRSSAGNAETVKGTTPLIGASKVMRPVFQQIAKACASSHPVVISGPPGSGRSHVARLIQRHADSTSEAKGCVQAVAGMSLVDLDRNLDRAKGGALILEELPMLSLELQADLFARLDRLESEGTRFIVTADEGGLRELVLEERLLPELYYRFQVLEISLPSLRERMEDIPALVSYFIGEQDPEGRRAMSDELEMILQGHDWPGNLRELRNVVNYLLVAGAGYQILTLDHLPPSFLEAISENTFSGDSLDRQLGEWIDRAFENAGKSLSYRDLHDRLEGRVLGLLLERFGDKPSRLAEALSMNRVTLRKKLKNREERDLT